MDMNMIGKALEYINIVVMYHPLWVMLLVITVTQMGKIWIHETVSDVYHRLLTRGLSALTGGVSGYFLLGGSSVEAIALGVAISAAISIAYRPLMKFLRSKESPWATALADWMGGK